MITRYGRNGKHAPLLTTAGSVKAVPVVVQAISTSNMTARNDIAVMDGVCCELSKTVERNAFSGKVACQAPTLITGQSPHIKAYMVLHLLLQCNRCPNEAGAEPVAKWHCQMGTGNLILFGE